MEINIILKIKEIFLLYIIILINFNILTEYDALIIIYDFNLINFSLLENKTFFEQIKIITDNNMLTKYLDFFYVIYQMNSYYINLTNLINNTKLFAINKRKIIIEQSEYFVLNNESIINNYNIINNEIEFLLNYINSYEINKNNYDFLFSFKSENINNKDVHKYEVINRIILIYNMLGTKLIEFILNKPNRKKVSNTKINIISIEQLRDLKYDELIKYTYIFFDTIEQNLKHFLKDFEFTKYLKIIMCTFFESKQDNITNKLHEKIVKKYINISNKS